MILQPDSGSLSGVCTSTLAIVEFLTSPKESTTPLMITPVPPFATFDVKSLKAFRMNSILPLWVEFQERILSSGPAFIRGRSMLNLTASILPKEDVGPALAGVWVRSHLAP